MTVSFLTLAFAQLWHVFNMRSRGSSPFRNVIVTNHGSGPLSHFARSCYWRYVPTLADILGVRPPTARGWMLVAALSALPMLIGLVVRRWPAPLASQE